ncbi:MAG: carbon-nitrogen hydrolase family protein [Pseudomonadota bacterium]|nr:carbon-nitrogen hydrolase family protein [Pseudomonadota bacterium]
MSQIRVAAIQMVSRFDVEANLSSAESLLQQAAAEGVQLAVLPENFAVLDSGNLYQWGEQERQQKRFTGFLAEQARRHRMQIVGGTVPLRERPDGTPVSGQRVRAASLLLDQDGSTLARYDKLHLFDAAVGDSQGQYQESSIIEPGDRWVTSPAVCGTLGLTVCYDLRFPALYQRLAAAGCDLITVPSAFTYHTGQAHWEALLRARAIENQVFVIAPNQGGEHSSKRRTWGHSMILDPWGEVLAQGESGPGLVIADLDLERLAEVQTAMPVRQHQRFTTAELV